MHKDEKLLSPAEVAELLGLKNPRTLSVWRSTKRYADLKWVKVGRLVKYTKSDVEAFIAARKRGG